MIPDNVNALIKRGALFVVNHSGGKDSQALYHYVMAHVPEEQVVVVHAILPEVEWDGVEEHVRATVTRPVYTCRARRTLIEMIEERGMFPSPSMRQCTSDLKRGPIEKTVRDIVKRRRALQRAGPGRQMSRLPGLLAARQRRLVRATLTQPPQKEPT